MKENQYRIREGFSLELSQGKPGGMRNSCGELLYITKEEAVFLALLEGGISERKLKSIYLKIYGEKGLDYLNITKQNLGNFYVLEKDTECITDWISPNRLNDVRNAILIDVNERKNYPTFVMWRMTEECNRRCIYCYTKGRRTHEILNLKIGKQLIAQASKYAVKGISLTGGDPLCYPLFYETIEAALNEGIEISLLTKNYVDVKRLPKNNLQKLYLGFSIDAYDRKIVNRLTETEGCFESIMKSINELNERKIPFSLQTTITSYTRDTLSETIEDLLALNPRKIKLCRYEKIGNLAKDRELGISDSEWEEIISKVGDKFKNEKIEFIGEEKNGMCIAGRKRLSIDEQGRYILCDRCTDATSEESIEKIDIWNYWNSDTYLKQVQNRRRFCAI